ncbi:MAG TPA: S24 family peptidase [Candidatus Rifleibacterium sp.]|nr:S24 family peptidase [Candidatus Rifleibacterium sp.]
MESNFDSFHQRLKRTIGNESVNSFAKKCEVSESLLRKYLSGDSLPGTKALVAIAEQGRVTLDWLATGTGPMKKGETLPAPIEPAAFTITNLEGRQVEFRPSPDLRHIPVLTVEAACGEGTVIPSESIKAVFSATDAWFRRELGANPENLVLIQARGDSMANTIMPEEMVFVDRSCVVEPCDGIWVFRNEEALFIKRLQFFPGRKVEVTSDNPRYKPYTMPITESFALLGQVIAALPLRRL